MGESGMEEMTLPSLFEQARKIHQMASDFIDQEAVRKGCQALEKCEEMISKLGLFSSNETKDDISTANLKYLLVPYYLGELTEKVSQDDRIQVLKVSQAKLKEFISLCEAMELVPQEEIESARQDSADAVADRRARKIARFKRQKAAESKLLEIKERKERRGRSTRAAALSTPVEVGEEDSLDDDGEEEREAWLTTISLALCKAFDLLEMLKKEEEMLSAMKEMQLQQLAPCNRRGIVGEREMEAAIQTVSPGWEFSCDFEVDYMSDEKASIVHTALAVDKELQPDKVKRQMSVSNGKLSVHFEAVEARFLRTLFSAFVDVLTRATKTIEEFGQGNLDNCV